MALEEGDCREGPLALVERCGKPDGKREEGEEATLLRPAFRLSSPWVGLRGRFPNQA